MPRRPSEFDESKLRKAYAVLVNDPVLWRKAGLSPSLRSSAAQSLRDSHNPRMSTMITRLQASGWDMTMLLRPAPYVLQLQQAFTVALAEEGSWKRLKYGRQTVLNRRSAASRGVFPGEASMRETLKQLGWKCVVQEQWRSPGGKKRTKS